MDSVGKRIVDGYMFKSDKDAESAQREYESIQNIKKKIDIGNTDEVYRLYVRLAEKKYFKTPVGIGFLHEMREYLLEAGITSELVPVPVPGITVVRQNGAEPLYRERYEKLKDDNEKLNIVKRKLMIAVAALTVIVIGMIFIVITNKNLGYFNAEEKVLDKYSAWQERLESWEQELIEREDALDRELSE